MSSRTPLERVVVRYDDVPGGHVAGLSNGVLIHLCPVSRDEAGRFRHIGPIFELANEKRPAVQCDNCLTFLPSSFDR
jgi:hypothetical protein